jgi:hypothetical protein
MDRIRFAALYTLVLGLSISTTAAETNPRLSETHLTAEQIAVYRSFLSSYLSGSKSD